MTPGHGGATSTPQGNQKFFAELFFKKATAYSPPHRLPSADIGRFLAALLVMFDHLPWFVPAFAKTPHATFMNGWYPPGPFGTQYYFALAGFILMLVHHDDFGRPGAALTFWWRRAGRIYPVYWLALAITFWCLAPYTRVTPGFAASSILLTPNVVANDFVGPAWTVRFEVIFYLMLGLCLLPRIGRFILIFWVALTIFACRPSGFLDPAWLHPLDSLTIEGGILWHFCASFEFHFFAGLAAGWLYLRLTWSRRTSYALIAAAIAIFALTCRQDRYFYYYMLPWFMPFLSLGYALLILGFANLDRLRASPPGRLSRFLGQLSYPLYILHVALMLAFSIIFYNAFKLSPAGLYVLFFAVAAGIVAICILVTIFLDQPLQNVLKGRQALLFLKKKQQKNF